MSTPLLDIQLPERDAEELRRNHAQAIRELQVAPLVGARVIADVALENGVETPIRHKLGRRVFALPSPPRGASTSGRIEEVRSASYDRSQVVVLKATGWGATVTVDLLVF